MNETPYTVDEAAEIIEKLEREGMITASVGSRLMGAIVPPVAVPAGASATPEYDVLRRLLERAEVDSSDAGFTPNSRIAVSLRALLSEVDRLRDERVSILDEFENIAPSAVDAARDDGKLAYVASIVRSVVQAREQDIAELMREHETAERGRLAAEQRAARYEAALRESRRDAERWCAIAPLLTVRNHALRFMATSEADIPAFASDKAWLESRNPIDGMFMSVEAFADAVRAGGSDAAAGTTGGNS